MTTVPQDQATTLVRIEVKLDQALRVGSDHETRIRSLERARWPLPALAILVALGSYVAPMLHG